MRKIDILNTAHEKTELDTVVYINKTIDEVCYIDSDGRKFTYRDIFETNNLMLNGFFKNGSGSLAVDWTIVNNPVTTWHSGEQTIESTDGVGNDRVEQDIDVIIDKEYYYAFESKLVSGAAGIYTIYFGATLGTNYDSGPIDNSDYEIRSGILLASQDTGTPIQFGVSGVVGKISVKKVLNIDLSIFKSRPSQTQLDTMLNIFLARRNITKETFTLREFMALNLAPNNRFEDGTEGCNAINSVITANNNILTLAGDNISLLPTLEIDNGFIIYEDHKNVYVSVIQKPVSHLVDTLKLLVESDELDSIDLTDVPTINVKYMLSGIFHTVSDVWADLYMQSVLSEITDEDVCEITEVVALDFINFDENMAQGIADYIVGLYHKVQYDIIDDKKT